MDIKTIGFTDRAIRELPPFKPKSGSRTHATEYTDRSLAGFKVQVSMAGKKHFLLRYTLNGRKGSIALGEFPAIKTAEARENALRFKAMVSRGEDPHREQQARRAMPLFCEYANDIYIPWAVRNKRSWKDDKSKLDLHLIPLLGKLPLDAITQFEIQSFLDRMSDTHSASTTNGFRSLLSKMYSMGMELGIVKVNPCTYIKKRKVPDFNPVVLTPEETYRLLVALDSDTNTIAAAALKILALTGCRREEILSAKWCNVDYEQATLYLPLTKAGKARHVALSGAVLDIFLSITPVPGSPWVFNGRAGSRLSDPRKVLWRALELAGLPRIRIHSLRHGAACAALNNGVDIASISSMLHHSAISTTMRYARIRDSTVRAAANTVSDLFMGRSKTESDPETHH